MLTFFFLEIFVGFGMKIASWVVIVGNGGGKDGSSAGAEAEDDIWGLNGRGGPHCPYTRTQDAVHLENICAVYSIDGEE